MYNFLINLLLISFTIPIHTKISIPKLPTKVSDFFSRSKEEITHHEFNDVEKLDLTNIHGDISVETWKQHCVLIEVRKKGSAHFLEQSGIDAQCKNHTLLANTKIKDATATGTIKIHILVPENLPLKLTTIHGIVSVQNHNGPLDLSTEWGAINVEEGNNTVLAKTIQGNITIKRKQMKHGHALNAQTSHGNITIMVPQDFGADMEAHTTAGKITSDIFISLHSQTILLNDETFKQMKFHVRGWVGHPQNTDNPTTILLTTDYGMINIIPYSKHTKPKK